MYGDLRWHEGINFIQIFGQRIAFEVTGLAAGGNDLSLSRNNGRDNSLRDASPGIAVSATVCSKIDAKLWHSTCLRISVLMAVGVPRRWHRDGEYGIITTPW
jgi:hypothetical protein